MLLLEVLLFQSAESLVFVLKLLFQLSDAFERALPPGLVSVEEGCSSDVLDVSLELALLLVQVAQLVLEGLGLRELHMQAHVLLLECVVRELGVADLLVDLLHVGA